MDFFPDLFLIYTSSCSQKQTKKTKPKLVSSSSIRVIITSPTPTKSVKRCCTILTRAVHANIELSAGKVFKRKRSIDKYIRRASASKKVRLSQPIPPRKLDLSDSSLNSSGDFRLNLSSDEEESPAAEVTNPGAMTAPAVPAASRDPTSSLTPAASPSTAPAPFLGDAACLGLTTVPACDLGGHDTEARGDLGGHDTEARGDLGGHDLQHHY